MFRNQTFAVTLAFISTMAMLGWLISDFFGGMSLVLISYPYFIIPAIILYYISLLDAIVSLMLRKREITGVKVILHFGLIILFTITNISIDFFKSKVLVTAIMIDDLYRFTLQLRENGDCEITAEGMFFYHEVFHGKYHFKSDTIIFTKVPYDNDFLPDSMLLDYESKAIFLKKDIDGDFIREKSFLNHFEIQ